MGDHLEMPAQRTGLGVESDNGIGVEIIAWSLITTIHWTRIANPHIDQVQVRIVGPRQPGGATAVLPGITAPGLMAGLPRPRHRVEPPLAFPGLNVVGIDEAPGGLFAGEDAQD